MIGLQLVWLTVDNSVYYFTHEVILYIRYWLKFDSEQDTNASIKRQFHANWYATWQLITWFLPEGRWSLWILQNRYRRKCSTFSCALWQFVVKTFVFSKQWRSNLIFPTSHYESHAKHNFFLHKPGTSFYWTCTSKASSCHHNTALHSFHIQNK